MPIRRSFGETFWRPAMQGKERGRWPCDSMFRNRGFAASSKSVVSKASLLRIQRGGVAKCGSLTQRGFWRSSTSGQTSICENWWPQLEQNSAGKFLM